MSIADVLDKTGCGRPIDAAAKPPVEKAVSCKIGADGDLAFLWELPSASAAKSWLAGGGIEIGTTDAVYIDGNVIMLATDAATSKAFAKIGVAYP
ncbi:hypothetical protein [Microbacterium sp. BH-3-3-3]|uniref:hypothetical protein n=1 Tax=Microbacterium sp. BH-3-3-3 TaxID=1906742 RepID=UPI00119FF35D|nr:hypothetical protein [Microbacterium sp. BH-3-3-3]